MIYNNHLDRSGGSNTLADLGLVVGKTLTALAKHRKKFDCIVVRGMSGALVGAPVAVSMEIPLVVVRKPSDCAHNAYRGVIGEVGDKPLFLDDFISGGSTCKAAMQAIGKPFIGSYEYDDDRWRNAKQLRERLS